MYPNLPYPSNTVSPFDVILSATQNNHDANIKSLADGTGFNDNAIKSESVDWTSLEQSQIVVAANSGNSTTAPAAIYSGNYTFVAGKKYLIYHVQSLTQAGASTIWNLSLRVDGSNIGGIRAESNVQYGSVIMKLFTAPASGSKAVSIVATRLSGSANFVWENGEITVIPVLN